MREMQRQFHPTVYIRYGRLLRISCLESDVFVTGCSGKSRSLVTGEATTRANELFSDAMSENVSHFECKTINSQLLHLIKTGNNLFLGVLTELVHMRTV
jgi:hypothetical protein